MVSEHEKSGVIEHQVNYETPLAVHTSSSSDGPVERNKVAVDYSGASPKTDPKEIALVRKLDIWVMPVVWLLTFLSFFNRQSIAVARLDGFEHELGLTGTQFSTVVSIHYVAYVLAQVPSNMLLTRCRPSLYLAGAMLILAVATGLTAVVKDYRGLMIQRFFLGIIGAPISPGALYTLSLFYKRKELATRLTIMFTASFLATATNGLIAAPIYSKLGGSRGISGWRWMYIIFGIISVVMAIISYFVLPDEPLMTKWLTPEQRQLAHDRVAADTVEKRSDNSMMRGLRDAAADRRVWAFVVTQHLNSASGSFRIFLPTLIRTLGFNQTITLVLACFPYLVATVTAISVAMSSGRHNERVWHLTGLKSLAIVGFVISCAPTNTGVRYFSTFVFVIGTNGPPSIINAWMTSTCGQTKEKRAAAIGIVVGSASSSLIWTPYLWPDSSAPRYILPLAASASFCVITIVVIWLIKWDLIRENKRRRRDPTNTLFYAY